MNRLRTKNLILTSLLVPVMLLTSCSFAGRYTRRPKTTNTPTTITTNTQTSVPTPSMSVSKTSSYYWGLFDKATINTYIDKASQNGIGIIYLDIEPFVSPSYNISQAISQLSPVVNYAKSKNISIQALIGAPNFAQSAQRPLVLKAMEIIIQFNNSQSIPITGIHLNIEFYNMPEFKADTSTSIKNSILVNYFDFHKTLVQLSSTLIQKVPSFELTSTLPHFSDFERADNPIPFIYYDGLRLSVFEHVARILNQIPNTSIVIMSYRSTAIGTDSISGLVQNEFTLISKYRTKIIIGVETNDIQSSYVSMYGKTKSEINSIISQVIDVYKSSPNFGGIAIHEIKAYLSAR